MASKGRIGKFAARRLCYDCKYMELWYEGGWSEWTPGEGFVCRCSAYRDGHYKSHWRIDDIHDMSKGKLRECLQMAEKCPDFKEASRGG